MVAPPAITPKVEVEFVPGSGTYVDISGRVNSIVIDRPRTAPGDDTATTMLELGLYNHPASAAEITAWGTAGGAGACPFTPDSPVAAFYPYVERDRRVKVTYVWATGSSLRFFGWIDIWNPDAGSSPPATAQVAVTGSCVLSKYARRKTLSFYGEQLYAFSNAAYWPLDDDPESTTFRCSSKLGNTAAATLVYPNDTNAGSATAGSVDAGILADGQMTFTRGDPPGGACPVLLMPLLSDVGQVSIAVKLATDPSGLADDICSAYDELGNRVWHFTASVVSTLIVFRIYDDLNVVQSEYATGATRDDAWRFFDLRLLSATTTAITTRKKGDTATIGRGGFGTAVADVRAIRYLVVGGQMPPFRKGKQTNTLQGSVSAVSVQYNSGSVFSYLQRAVPGIVSTADDTFNRFANWGTSIDTLVGGAVTGATVDATQVQYTLDNPDLLSMFNQHARTVGGLLSTLPDGRRSYLPAAETRLPSVVLTLDAERDLHAPAGGWAGVKDERPTRITVEGPFGSVTQIDPATEAATGLQLEGRVGPTSAGTDTVAASVAGRILSAGRSRLNSFGAEWTSTSTDKVAAAMALKVGDRMRITTLPSAYMGFTQVDVYASGWTELTDPADSSVSFIFDTDPADDPVESIWDDAATDRWGMAGSTVTGGTCVGTTATGTLIITSPSDPLTTVAGEYPLNLDWNGERVTISGVGGATSPQTATVTARGVAPTVARVHAAGEPVDVYSSFTWSA